MKKKAIQLIVALVLVFSLGTPSMAVGAPYSADSDDSIARASQYISSYSAVLTPEAGGLMHVSGRVIGTGVMGTIGTTGVVLQRNYSGVWASVCTWDSIYHYNTNVSAFTVSYPGIPGVEYRAIVVFYAGNTTGSESRTMYTIPVIAKS